MAYEKQTWNTGDVISAEKLNHMEDGIGFPVYATLTISSSDNTSATCNLTRSEIEEILKTGTPIIMTAVLMGGDLLLMAGSGFVRYMSGIMSVSLQDGSSRWISDHNAEPTAWKLST